MYVLVGIYKATSYKLFLIINFNIRRELNDDDPFRELILILRLADRAIFLSICMIKFIRFIYTLNVLLYLKKRTKMSSKQIVVAWRSVKRIFSLFYLVQIFHRLNKTLNLLEFYSQINLDRNKKVVCTCHLKKLLISKT